MVAVRWNDEMDAVVKKFWLTKTTLQAIGDMLGVSRNAVIGRAHRINLPTRAPVRTQGTPRTRRPSAFIAPKDKIKIAVEANIEPLCAPETFPGKGKCLYMHGDPSQSGWQFCGHDTNGKNFCAYHAQRVYVPNVVGKVKT